jgi:hypothetical protein
MTQLNLLQNHLRETYQKWSALSDSNKKQKINLILPFIQLNSYLDAIAQNENSRHELEDFGNEYERIYGVNIREILDCCADVFTGKCLIRRCPDARACDNAEKTVATQHERK